jgi:hypothetical protein
MKKTLALTVLSGLLLAASALSGPGEAIPFRPEALVSQNQTQQSQGRSGPAADPKAGWEVPDVTGKSITDIVPVKGDDGEPVIQVALLLDTSGSMSPLIDQAKTELWSIVNKLGQARYKGKAPKIEVALFEYGKSSLEREGGYIKMLAPFTHDLDGLSEVLFGLNTNGGEEYCAWVIRSALDSLKWKSRPGALKMVFIAGNEPFDQGPVEVDSVLQEADRKGVLVHPILCSTGDSRDQISWNRAADLAHTDLKVIDHTRVVQIPKTPYDARLAELGSELNKTYIGYGEAGRAKAARQVAQDANIAGVGAPAAAERSVAKASGSYRNADWDVVDRAEEAGGVASLRDEELPAEMRGMSLQEREAYVAKKARERAAIQSEIKELSAKRQAYIEQEQRKAGQTDATLGSAVIETVRSKAQKEGFTL